VRKTRKEKRTLEGHQTFEKNRRGTCARRSMDHLPEPKVVSSESISEEVKPELKATAPIRC